MGNTVKNYVLYNLTLTLANTEYSQALTEDRCFIRIHSTDLSSSARLSFTAAGSGTGEIIFAGAEWFTPAPMANGAKTVYLQSPNAGAVFQIVVFEIQ